MVVKCGIRYSTSSSFYPVFLLFHVSVHLTKCNIITTEHLVKMLCGD